MYRPSTSKPRGICKYYTSPRGCFQGDRCKFLHGEQETLTPYDKSKTCRYFAQGYCKRGADCWFRHVVPDANTPGAAHAPPPMTADATICGICLEEPTTFGLLSGCSHIFCVECLRNWRDREGKNEEMLFSHVNKKCPYCRTFSKSVTPSSHFYPDGHPGKAAAIERHKASTSRIPCRYFQESQPNDRFCPFGRDCIYLHENEDGTPYIFHAGVDHYMRQLARRTQRSRESTERLFIENTVNRFLSTSMQDMNLYIEDIRTLLTQSEPQNQPATVQNRRSSANPATGDHRGQSSSAEGMQTLAGGIIRDMRHLSADIEAILTNSLRPTITTLISRADERLITTINNTPHTDVPHVPPIPLRPFDLGLNSSQRPASPALSTNSLPALESISDSESESHYSGFIDDDDDDDDSSNVPERRLNRSAELEVLIARLWSAVSGVARAQGDARSVEPQEPNPEPYEAPEPPSPQFVPLPQLPDDRQDDNVSTPTVVHPEEPEGLLPDAGSFSAGEDHPPDETGLPPPVTIPSDMPTDSVSIGDASDPASTDLPSAPSSVVPPTTQETENPQPPNPDAEPPFMTDGRGRVVWSRVGSKTGGVHGRGRGRPGDTEDTGSG